MKASNPRNTKAITITCVLAVLVAGICFVWSTSALGKGADNLRIELNKAANDGMPVDAESLRKQIAIPKEQNAGPQLSEAFRQFKLWDSTPEGRSFSKLSKRLRDSKDLSSAEIDSLRPILASADQMLKIVRNAVVRPMANFNRAWEQGPALNLPEFSYARSACSLLVVQARISKQAGQIDEALSTLGSAIKLSNLMGQEPLLIGVLVDISTSGSTLKELEQIVKSHANDRSVLEKCRATLETLNTQPNIQEAIGAEMVMGRIAVKMLGTSSSEQLFGPSEGSAVPHLARIGPVRSVYEYRYVQLMHNLYQDLGKAKGSVKAIRAAFTKVDAKMQGKADWTYGLAEFLSPSFSHIANVMGEAQARKNVLLCGIDLLVSKGTDHFPNAIPKKTGQWVDPFSDKPLLYKPQKAGFVIYSIGPNEKDDHGMPRRVDKASPDYDIPFSYP